MKRVPAAVLFSMSVGGASLAGVDFTTVALTGQQAPGLPAGTSFAFFSDARMSASGHIAFWAELAGPGITGANDGSLWVGPGTAVALANREGEAVPGAAGMVFSAFPRPALSAAGVLAYAANIVPASEPSAPMSIGVFSHSAGPVLLAREGEPATGLPAGSVYAGFTTLAVGPNGTVIWQGNAGAAAWAATEGAGPVLLAVRGQGAGGTAGAFDFIDEPSSGAGGAVVIRATTDESPSRLGLWVDPAQAPAALTGSPPPGVPAGVMLDHLAAGPVACAGGCIAYWGRLSGAGVSAGDDGVIVGGDAGAPVLIAREGDAAPGTGAEFGVLSARLATTPLGAVAFGAFLSGAGVTELDNSAMYLASQGMVTLVAREGDPAPGLADASFAGFDAPVVSPGDEMVFIAHLRGAGVTAASNRALYARRGSGELELLVRAGDPFDTGAGVRVVEEIVIDADPSRAGHSAFEATPAGAVLLFKLHFKDPGPNNTVVRSSGLFTAAIGAGACYANCDGSTVQPVLNVADFTCFLQRFGAGESYANCDGSATAPVLNVADFTCYLQRFAAGCR